MKTPYFMSPREKTLALAGPPMLVRYVAAGAVPEFKVPPEFNTWGPILVGDQWLSNVTVGEAFTRLAGRTKERIRRGVEKFFREKQRPFDNRITAAKGLLWRNGEVMGCPQADYIAHSLGFACAERLVHHLQGTGASLISDPSGYKFVTPKHRPIVRVTKQPMPNDTVTIGDSKGRKHTFTFVNRNPKGPHEIPIGANPQATADRVNALIEQLTNMPKSNKPTPPPPKKKPTKVTTESLSAHALRDAIEFAAEYGRVTAIAAMMSKITGESITRQMVGRWLNPEADKRQQPSFGNAILLLIAVDIIRGNTDPSATNLCVEVPAMQIPKLK